MTLYSPWLVTLNYVRRDRRLLTAETGDDTLIQQFIAENSADFQSAVNRVFLPYLATTTHDYRGPRVLEFEDDVLALTSVTNGDSTSMTVSQLLLEPNNVYPKWRANLSLNASSAFTFQADPRQAISMTAWRGCVPNYATGCFRVSGAVIPSGVTSSTTTMALASGKGALFEVGQYIAVTTSSATEIMQITAIASDTLTHTRAEQGTTAALHNAGDVIQIMTPVADVQKAVREMVVYAYLNKDSVGKRTIMVNGAIVVEDLDPSVQKTMDRYTNIAVQFGVM